MLHDTSKISSSNLKLFYIFSIVNMIASNLAYILVVVFTSFSIYWGALAFVFTLFPYLFLKGTKVKSSISSITKKDKYFEHKILLLILAFGFTTILYLIFTFIQTRYALIFLVSSFIIYFIHLSVYLDN